MELLNGWKEIADHLHLTVRTAQRWERLGLPVRRVSDSSGSPVVGIPDELELWARTRVMKSDRAVLEANKMIAAECAELRGSHSRTRRRTRRLLNRINSLAMEQATLLRSIRSNLVSPVTKGGASGNGEKAPATRR